MKNVFIAVAVFFSVVSSAVAALPEAVVGVYRCPLPAGDKIVELKNLGEVPYMVVTLLNQDVHEGAPRVMKSRSRGDTTVAFENQIMTVQANGAADSNGFACQKVE